ncbi:MAG: glycosyltransferase [Candidatus Nanopelagicales bacterium]
MKVLMVSPFTPLYNTGGAEVAASRLADELSRAGDDVTDVWRVSALPDGIGASSPVSALADGSFAISGGYSDTLRFISRRSPWAVSQLAEWLGALAPDVVHLHHFLGVGSDMIPTVRRALPGSRIVYTAHEFLLMCANDGKLVRRSGRLCEGPSNIECASCVASAPVDLFLRDDYLKNIASLVDDVISPSDFLAGRLRTWLHSHRVHVIPNCPPVDAGPFQPRELRGESGRNRVGFFGQIIPSKGLHILLDAAAAVSSRGGSAMEVLVFGTRPDPQYWTEEIAPRLARLAEGPVRASYLGEYAPDRATETMSTVDWVAVPSLWWENAPTVMVEAAAAGRPMLVGDIGGMREYLSILGSGVAVPRGSVAHWAEVLERVTAPRATAEWTALHERARLPWTPWEITQRHLRVYRGL